MNRTIASNMLMNQPRRDVLPRHVPRQRDDHQHHQHRRDHLGHHEPRDLDPRRSCGSSISQRVRGLPVGQLQRRVVDHVAERAVAVSGHGREIPGVSIGRSVRGACARMRPDRLQPRRLPDRQRPAGSGPRPLAGDPEDVHHPDGEPQDRPEQRRPGGSIRQRSIQDDPSKRRQGELQPHGRDPRGPLDAHRQDRAAARDRVTHDSRPPRRSRRRGATRPRPGEAIGPRRPRRTTRQGEPLGEPFIPGPTRLSTPQPPASRNFSQSRRAQSESRWSNAGLEARRRRRLDGHGDPVVTESARAVRRSDTRAENFRLTEVRHLLLPRKLHVTPSESGSSQCGDSPCRHPCAPSPTDDDQAASSRDRAGRRPPFVVGSAAGVGWRGVSSSSRRWPTGWIASCSPGGMEFSGSAHSGMNHAFLVRSAAGARAADGDGVAPHDRRIAQGLQ